MPTYTNSANVQAELPDNLPSGWVTSHMTDLISKGSNQVEDLVGTGFGFNYKSNAQKFPDIGDSTPTPALIELCARWLAAAEGYALLKEHNKFSEDSSEESLRTKANELLKEIRERDIDVSLSGSSLRRSHIDHITDQHIYESDDTDPTFNKELLNDFF